RATGPCSCAASGRRRRGKDDRSRHSGTAPAYTSDTGRVHWPGQQKPSGSSGSTWGNGGTRGSRAGESDSGDGLTVRRDDGSDPGNSVHDAAAFAAGTPPAGEADTRATDARATDARATDARATDARATDA